MTAPERAPSGDSYYQLPHPMTYVLASGIYWRAGCQCHLNRVVGINHRADRTGGTR